MILRCGCPWGPSIAVEPLAGRAAGFVLQQDGAVDDVGLLFVVGRHGDAPRQEFELQREKGFIVTMKREAERCGDCLAGKVIFRGAEAAGENDDVGAADRDGGGGGEMVEVIADDGFEGDRDAELVEGSGEVKRVGVLTVRRQHLGTGGDDFGDHAAFDGSW